MEAFREALRSRPVPVDRASGRCDGDFCNWMRRLGFEEAVDEVLSIRPETNLCCLMHFMATQLDDGHAIEYVASLLSPERITPLPLHIPLHTRIFRDTWVLVLARRMSQLQLAESRVRLDMVALKMRSSDLQHRFDRMQSEAADTLMYIKDLSGGTAAVTLEVPVPSSMSELVDALKYHPGSRAAAESQADFSRLAASD